MLWGSFTFYTIQQIFGWRHLYYLKIHYNAVLNKEDKNILHLHLHFAFTSAYFSASDESNIKVFVSYIFNLDFLSM